MKKNIIDFIAGILIVVIVLLTMNFISLDMRIVTLLGATLLACYSYIISKKERKQIFTILIASTPISCGFIFGILPELPSLWTAIPVFLLASFLGFILSKKRILILASVLFIGYSFILVPILVESNLSKFVNEKAPNVSLQFLDTNMSFAIPNREGKVTVLDFYGTWCKPCIEEMSELKEIKRKYKNTQDVEFVLVCTEYAKDTSEKAKKFIEKRNLGDFTTVFDSNNEAHKAFGFTGVPALVIIDKQGIVKFKHEGYNTSENLSKTLTEVIDNLIRL